MRIKGFLLALTAACVLALPGMAAPPDRADADRLAGWVAQLGSNQFKERQSAMANLEAAGAPALEALRESARDGDPEVSRRSQELVQRIERRLQNERLLAAKRVHLVCKDQPVTDALADFTKKTGIQVNFDAIKARLTGRKITLDTGETTPWQALDLLCAKAGLVETTPAVAQGNNPYQVYTGFGGQFGGVMRNTSYSPYMAPAGDGRITLAEGKPANLSCCADTTVRVRALPASTSFPNEVRGAGEIMFGVEVTPAPQLFWLGVVDVRIDRAVSEHGQDLKQSLVASNNRNQNQNVYWMANGGMVVLEDFSAAMALQGNNPRYVPIRLKESEKAAKALRELKGTMVAQVQTPPEPLMTMDNILEASGKSVRGPDGMSLKVLDVNHKDSTVKVRVEVKAQGMGFNPGIQFAAVVVRAQGKLVVNGRQQSGEIAGLPISLVDAKGQTYQLVGMDNPQQAINLNGVSEFQLTFQAKKGQEAPARLVYTGQRTVMLEVPFTLKDVPLP